MNKLDEACSHLTDQEIIQLSLEQRDYFGCLHRRYEKKMIHYIIKISGLSIEEAEDILQDAFIKIWRNLHLYKPELSFSSWVYRIVHNETVSQWRKNKTLKTFDQPMPLNAMVMPDDYNPELKNTDQDIYARVQKILGSIKKEYREVLILKYFENLSYEEISDVLRIPEGTVATRINRAKKAFKGEKNDLIHFFE